MTEEMPNTKKNSVNVKLLVILGIVLIGCAIGGYLLFSNKNDKKEPKTITIEAIIDKDDAASITYSPQNSTSSNLRVGSEIELAYVFDIPVDKKVEWVLSNNNIAKVENNKIIGLSAGTVKIQGIYKGKKTIKSNFISLTFE